ncbi:hypothetical protein [Xenorhabdus szentirmaii]|uniref:hypothetical protein n=1 Tax=Xenorhabdus szentirmaii TaxID=290112 RepID=UPI0019CB2755|nr:hypothetical protein [Xenorhabdus sp. 38]MBD2782516.1 hypothetical protein [Xenorhabdus sp. 38]
MAKHIHADLIMAYAKYAQETSAPWTYFQTKRLDDTEWLDCRGPVEFWFDREYRLKPKTIRIGEFDVPEPVREPLEKGTEYYLPAVNNPYSLCSAAIYDGKPKDFERLSRGVIHLDRGSAEIHATALISLTAK